MKRERIDRGAVGWAITVVAVLGLVLGVTALPAQAAHSGADLSVSPADAPDPVVAGDPLLYVLDVTNLGPETAENAQVQLTLPSGVAVASTDPAFLCGVDVTVDPDVATCPVGDLAVGATASVNVLTRVDVDVPGGTVLSATAEVSSATVDPHPGNDVRIQATEVVGAPFYVMVEMDGTVHAFPEEKYAGDADLGTDVEAVDIAINPAGTGYYVLDDTGAVHALGSNSTSQGNLDPASLTSGEVPTALALTESGDGYWIFTNLGRAEPFGDAADIGDVSDLDLQGQIVDASPYPPGYYMTGADGGVFTPSDFVGSQAVPFLGSVPQVLAPGSSLNEPIVTIYVDATDDYGYSLAASDGGIFNFESEFCGSIPGVLDVPLNQPVVNAVPYGDCYIFFAADGGAFVFGDLPFLGSLGDSPPDTPIVSGDAFGTAAAA